MKEEVLAELRQWAGVLDRWRRIGVQRPRYGAENAMAWKNFRHWFNALSADSHPVLIWGAQELLTSGQEYLSRQYNAYYCRLRRLNNALARWEDHDVDPVQFPTRYTVAARRRLRPGSERR